MTSMWFIPMRPWATNFIKETMTMAKKNHKRNRNTDRKSAAANDNTVVDQIAVVGPEVGTLSEALDIVEQGKEQLLQKTLGDVMAGKLASREARAFAKENGFYGDEFEILLKDATETLAVEITEQKPTPKPEPKKPATPVAVVEQPQPKEIIPATVVTKKSATATGAAYHVLAGRPSKQAVIACFGKTGYALSWVARAIRLNVTPEELCADFKSNAEAVKARWGVLEKKSA